MSQPRSLTIPSTLPLAEAAAERFDVAVAGAGPAGALTALLLARRGLRVVLVEGASLPRRKVCGGCLSASATEILAQCGVEDLLERERAVALDGVTVVARGRETRLPLPRGAALSREVLDAALVRAALAEGAELLERTTALSSLSSSSGRAVELAQGGRRATIACRVVVAATGLGGRFLRGEPLLRARIAARSRVGLGAVVERACDLAPAGRVTMVWSPRGYVGLARVEDGRTAIAAAVDRELVRGRGPADVVTAIFRASGVELPEELAAATWHGTPPLTQSLERAASRALFVLGDAAGYVEPFTGEGIAWALASARALAPIAADAAANGWSDAHAHAWEADRRALLARRQRRCARVTRLLRSSVATRSTLFLLRSRPRAARRLAFSVHGTIPSGRAPTL